MPTFKSYPTSRRNSSIAKLPLIPLCHNKGAKLAELARQHRGNLSETQCRRLVTALKQFGEVTVIEAREFLDTLHAPARVLNLKQAGYLIADRWVRQPTGQGNLHRTKAYTLIGEPGGVA